MSCQKNIVARQESLVNQARSAQTTGLQQAILMRLLVLDL